MVAAIDMELMARQLEGARKALSEVSTNNKTLPLGVGFLPFATDIDAAISIVSEYRPAMVWIFTTHTFADFGVWANRIRTASPCSKIWVQTGTVSAALEIASICSPNLDAIVLQGSDAGGHGFEHGASIISLLPEATEVLHANGLGHLPLIASGGIVDGRGVAAALALGGAGVVMGTRFLATPESNIHPAYQKAVLMAKDGALSTVRAKVFDELKGKNIWPALYNGRALATESYQDHKRGVDIERLIELHSEAAANEDGGFSGRAAVWAGAGVGLVNEVMSASDIVKQVQNETKAIISKLKA